ncbi:hypothetical protein KHC28_02815 [Ancylobacter sonchi]|uniref:hypothetical protein n=1 Tax=Ancylobacter sonchi TaxID=1937790 RepID=UPI001BD33064|nr:hypothetical protein [Ancylobacter sonchi]MBS7532586.1 hypothetical protein [Ancylobacter sonchi]
MAWVLGNEITVFPLFALPAPMAALLGLPVVGGAAAFLLLGFSSGSPPSASGLRARDEASGHLDFRPYVD